MCLVMGRFEHSIRNCVFKPAHNRHDFRRQMLRFLYIRMIWLAIKVKQIIDFHRDFDVVLSFNGELEETKPLPVALTSNIACDLS